METLPIEVKNTLVKSHRGQAKAWHVAFFRNPINRGARSMAGNYTVRDHDVIIISHPPPTNLARQNANVSLEVF